MAKDKDQPCYSTRVIKSLSFLSMSSISSKRTGIYYEILGENNTETIVLISGLNTQRMRWGLPFYENLIHSGCRILRLDNCDRGKSEWNEDEDKNPGINSLAVFLQDPTEGNMPYTPGDMAGDIRSVMCELGFKKVDVRRRPIGGVIAQLLTFRYPSLVKTLTLMISTSLHQVNSKPDPNMVGLLMRIPKVYLKGKEVTTYEKLGFSLQLSGTKCKVDLQKNRKIILEAINRNNGQSKPFRQTALASYVYNKPIITAIQTPNLSMPGTEEPLFHPKNAKDLANSLPDSRLIFIERIGRAISKNFFENIAEDIKIFIKE